MPSAVPYALNDTFLFILFYFFKFSAALILTLTGHHAVLQVAGLRSPGSSGVAQPWERRCRRVWVGHLPDYFPEVGAKSCSS